MNWWAKLSQREKRFFYIAALAVSLVFLDRFVLQSALNKISLINTEIDEIQQKLGADQYYLKNAGVIQQEYQNYISRIKAATSVTNATALQELVERIAADSSVSVEGIQPYSIRDGQNKIAVQFNCFGKGTEMMTFLYKISMDAPLLKTEKISVSPKGDDFVANIILFQVPLRAEQP